MHLFSDFSVMQHTPSSFYGPRVIQHRFLRDAVDAATEAEGDVDIVLTGPPPGGDGSDVEDVEEDALEEAEDLPVEVAGELETITHDDVDAESTTPAQTKKRRKIDSRKWTDSHISSAVPPTDLASDKANAKKKLVNASPELTGATEWQVFQKVFQNMLDHLVVETNRYALQDKNNHTFQITESEMRNFVGLLLLSGYNIRLNIRDYWSKSFDLECKAFAECMSRSRFLHIKSFLHVANTESLGKNKMAKITPFYEVLNESLRTFGVLHENLSIDESMVPYFGRHSCKQFIRAKPIRFGYKLWVIASSCGVPYYVSIYEGKSTDKSSDPLGTRVVLDCTSVCSTADHHLIFDNFFTSYNLIERLTEMGYKATGTIRQNRIGDCPLRAVDKMKKESRGSFQYKSDGNIELVRWNDNNVVTFCSNAVGSEPMGQAKRWVKGKGQISVTQPAVVKVYNECMGGVDLVDRALSDFRPKIGGKKWYWSLLINAINIATVFSWRVFQLASTSSIPHKEFRRSIVSVLLKMESPRLSIDSRPGPSSAVAPEVRYDNLRHYPVAGPVRRCVLCKKNCRIVCSKCLKALHVSYCFQKYHEK